MEIRLFKQVLIVVVINAVKVSCSYAMVTVRPVHQFILLLEKNIHIQTEFCSYCCYVGILTILMQISLLSFNKKAAEHGRVKKTCNNNLVNERGC